ncbi:hypothetical protein CI109_105360 [Kwoniella shandongensis]|uniref:NADH dehydrogenase [ubiquinone] iron-sulfur protein 4, mitochondrial n=1 Tax=Kwoniella shandongensis TaxID=1734106 RepID=A0A5M6BPB7_9TREE|nr:uncharacterized protein CI109_006945 [Kwoniella shandongensis]KAA5524738.1 hypothetical protein CI109_006945 [Kwoniella shandongensis]
MLSLRPLFRTAAAAGPTPLVGTTARRAIHLSSPRFNESKSSQSQSPVPAPTQPGQSNLEEYDFGAIPQAELVSGAPVELSHRPVRIYRPTKTTMQSAKGKTKRWIIDFDVLQGSGRWENPLMGWAASADYMQGTSLFFRSKEEAVGFAEKQGWRYKVDEPKKVIVPPKNYANNYVHVPGKLRIHHTK